MKVLNICLVTLGISLIQGCGNPETSRLSVGQKVMGVCHDRKYDYLLLEKSGDQIWPRLVLGTHMTVVDDEDKPEDTQGIRDVKVHIEDGEHRGKTGVLTRWDLRPE